MRVIDSGGARGVVTLLSVVVDPFQRVVNWGKGWWRCSKGRNDVLAWNGNVEVYTLNQRGLARERSRG